MESRAQQLSQLLESWSEGDQGAVDKLVPLVYEDLYRLAHRYMARRTTLPHPADYRVGE
jgi:hypothetical protein